MKLFLLTWDGSLLQILTVGREKEKIERKKQKSKNNLAGTTPWDFYCNHWKYWASKHGIVSGLPSTDGDGKVRHCMGSPIKGILLSDSILHLSWQLSRGRSHLHGCWRGRSSHRERSHPPWPWRCPQPAGQTDNAITWTLPLCSGVFFA